jgi:sulfite exporter TauE/SafE
MENLSVILLLAFGFALGLKHATEADHLVAVSTIVSRRKSLWSSALVGGLWGVGHTISLLICGALVLFLEVQISERTEKILEFLVGVMLIVLGVNVLRKLIWGARIHIHTHAHGGLSHAHVHVHDQKEADKPETHHGLEFGPRALLVGMVHGLAGSAALMLLVVPVIESKIVGMLYLLVFGLGSIGGMMLMSFLVGMPFHLTASRFNRFNSLLQTAAGLTSTGIGLWIVFVNGFGGGLFG